MSWRVAIFAGDRGVEIGSPLFQRRPFGFDRIGTVGEVVGVAHEGVQRAHATPLGPRQHLEGMKEVARLAPGQALAVTIGRLKK